MIKNSKKNSAPGQTGFQFPYYKVFATTVAPYMAKFKTKGNPFDTQLNSAFITVIPKPDKDLGEVNNYRPISLINKDLKIMTKVMAD